MKETGVASDTTVITVSYNSGAVLRGLLKSLGGDARCVIVDNGGHEELQPLADDFGARLLRLETNQGFGRGCNAGAALATTEFLFFVNPDVALENGCIAALEAAARQVPQLAAANPRVLDGRGRVAFKTTSILLEGGGRRMAAPDGPCEVPVLTGCALFVRRSLFEAVGGFDPAIFLYHEDHDLAVRLARHGSLWCIPQAVVRHVAGTGAPRTAQVARFKGYHMARSRHYVLHKHRRAMAFLRTLAPALGGILLPHNLLSPRRRARCAGQIAGALSSFGDFGEYSGK